MLRFKFFVSSPGDVGPERAVALDVAERLQFEFRGRIKIETYLWERSLLRATSTFQEQILDIQDADLAIFILWSRIGTPLPREQFSRPDGTPYDSGTDYEFERAREAYDQRKSPDILCYVKTAEVRLSLQDPEARRRREAEFEAVCQFTDKWFRGPDGTFKAAFHNFEKIAQFEELLEVHLREWIQRRLRGVELASAEEPMWKESPFRGLLAFDFEHSLIYCGRTTQVSEMLDGLRRRGAAGRGFVMVTGMSGVGKSSLVRAGVLPLLTRPRVIESVSAWRRAIFKPNVGDEKLLPAFAASLLRDHALPELAREGRPIAEVLHDPTEFASLLVRGLDHATREESERGLASDADGHVQLIVLCDQFEEIFDETVTAQERTVFVEALRGAVSTGRVWVIATLRADFFGRCSELPERFRDLFIDRGGIFTVGGPRPVELGQMIRRPALIAGLEFERRGDPDEGLDDVLRDAAVGNPTVLPLLEFTLDELWRRSAGSGLLRFSDYEDLGGLHGALRLRADQVFSSLDAKVRASLPKVLAALVHTDPTDERLVLQNRVSLSELSTSSESRTLVGAFVAAHLFVGDRASDGTAVIGLAHEALLREWPPAVEWYEQNREQLRLRSGVAAAAALWRNSHRHEDRLVTGALLKDATKLLSTNPDILAPEEQRFVELSIERDRGQRKRRVLLGAVLSSLVAVAILLPVIGFGTIGHALAMARAIPTAWKHVHDIPMSGRAQAHLDRSADQLAGFLISRVQERASRPDLTAWSLAQMWVALYGLDASLDGKTLREAVTATRDPACYCWREDDSKPPNSMATAWVVFALARYDEPATVEELEWFLHRQAPAGWWSMYPAAQDEGNASSAATAFIILALHEQVRHKLLPPEQQARITEAIDRGVRWLVNRAVPGKARWTEYPPDHTFEHNKEYFAVSAVVVNTIHTVTGAIDLDPVWLSNLPDNAPGVAEDEQAKGLVFVSKSQFVIDDVRHYRYPWMLRTTLDCYAHGDLLQRARALVWLDEALQEAPSVEDLHQEGWTTAEVLFALRYAQSVLRSKSDLQMHLAEQHDPSE